MNKEMYLTEHLVLPSEATLSQTSELDGVRKLSIHLRRGLALGSGPDEKVASDFTSVPDPIERRLRQCQTPVRGDADDTVLFSVFTPSMRPLPKYGTCQP